MGTNDNNKFYKISKKFAIKTTLLEMFLQILKDNLSRSIK